MAIYSKDGELHMLLILLHDERPELAVDSNRYDIGMGTMYMLFIYPVLFRLPCAVMSKEA